MTGICQNPDVSCDRKALCRYRGGLALCRRCYGRFWRHGHGRPIDFWGDYWKKRDAVAEKAARVRWEQFKVRG